MKDIRLENLLGDCIAKDTITGQKALRDLRYVLERYKDHDNQEKYKSLLAHRSELLVMEVRPSDIQYIWTIFSYLLKSFPDRVVWTVKCMEPCYTKSFRTTVCEGIERYYAHDDNTAYTLVKMMIKVEDLAELGDSIRELLYKLQQEGLPKTKQLATVFLERNQK